MNEGRGEGGCGREQENFFRIAALSIGAGRSVRQSSSKRFVLGCVNSLTQNRATEEDLFKASSKETRDGVHKVSSLKSSEDEWMKAGMFAQGRRIWLSLLTSV